MRLTLRGAIPVQTGYIAIVAIRRIFAFMFLTVRSQINGDF
jgi:hypothetical protein